MWRVASGGVVAAPIREALFVGHDPCSNPLSNHQFASDGIAGPGGEASTKTWIEG
jgi:hypothetical protein